MTSYNDNYICDDKNKDVAVVVCPPSWIWNIGFVSNLCSSVSVNVFVPKGSLAVERLTEHKRATRKGDTNNHIEDHHQLTNHSFEWDCSQYLTYGKKNYFQRVVTPT